MSNRMVFGIIVVLLGLFWGLVLSYVWHYASTRNEHRVDCSMVEFHPDYTTKMREQCRAARKTT